MDSVSQAALGASIGVLVMGRSRPLWQSALVGAVVGTLPDMDVFIEKGDPVRDMVLHRAETHAIFWQAVASPLIAGILAGLTGSKALYLRWLMLVMAGLFTHSWLDAMTVYGTRVALPFSDYPFGIASLFIIDPLYTLPLLVGLTLTLTRRRPHRLRWNMLGLMVSTTYAGWSLVAQAQVTDMVSALPAAKGLASEQVLVTPTPFNTILWRIVLRTEEAYAEGFYSLLDKDRSIRFAWHPRGNELEDRTEALASANMVRSFSKGFYRLTNSADRIVITDLRMGQHPFFAFSFAVARHDGGPATSIPPVRLARRMPFEEGLEWLWRRLRGHDLPPPRIDGQVIASRP